MVIIRRAEPRDLINIQACNAHNLPVSYVLHYYMHHLITWPQLLFIAEDEATRTCIGYVLARIEDEQPRPLPFDPDEDAPEKLLDIGRAEYNEPHGHIVSLGVSRQWRRMGIGRRLMEYTSRAMIEMYNVRFVTLNVNVDNHAAVRLYRDSLGFCVDKIRPNYYSDGSAAYAMLRDLVAVARKCNIKPANSEVFFRS